jgi:hypothetical protein
MPFRLAIVGARSLAGHGAARRAICDVLDAYQAERGELIVISGEAAGVDRMAAAEARRRGLIVVEHRTAGRGWPAARERNLLIAKDCDHLVRIADRQSKTYGSGWTRDRARELGKPTEEYMLDSASRDAEPARHQAEADR